MLDLYTNISGTCTTPLKSKVKKKYQPQNNNNISKLKFLS